MPLAIAVSAWRRGIGPYERHGNKSCRKHQADNGIRLEPAIEGVPVFPRHAGNAVQDEPFSHHGTASDDVFQNMMLVKSATFCGAEK